MKKIHKISLRVIIVFSIGIVSTFVTDHFHDFFGDWTCKGCNYGESGYFATHQPTLHWGYRHWLYFLMCLVLFVIQAIDIIEYANSNKKQ
jgi:hypothetical protein